MKRKTYKIYTLGCKVNQYDSGKLAAELESAGLVAADKNADLAIINSCAVTQTAMNKSARAMKLAEKENPGAKIILAGCWAKLRGENPKLQISTAEQSPNSNNQNNKLIIKNKRARYFIKIQDGCEQFCTYCVVPYLRGRLTSRPEAEVTAEIKQAAAAGFEEIVLSGIHLGLYGKDAKSSLSKLLKKLAKIKNLKRVRLSSIEITEVNNEIVKLIKAGKVCKHLHVPLQSGSDKILKLMNRPYTIKNYELRIKKIRKIIPDIAITTDVIVGFPGETAKDFKATENFIKKIKFSRLHVFPFSAQAKTPAFKLPNQVKENEKLRRAGKLRKLGLKLASGYKKKFRNRRLELVIEKILPDKIIGKSQYYFDLEIERDKLKNKNPRTGQIVKVKN